MVCEWTEIILKHVSHVIVSLFAFARSRHIGKWRLKVIRFRKRFLHSLHCTGSTKEKKRTHKLQYFQLLLGASK